MISQDQNGSETALQIQEVSSKTDRRKSTTWGSIVSQLFISMQQAFCRTQTNIKPNLGTSCKITKMAFGAS
jgi:hypothetical protein